MIGISLRPEVMKGCTVMAVKILRELQVPGNKKTDYKKVKRNGYRI